MEILINGRTASLQSEFSADLVFENRSFSGSDTYSLSITFPLAGDANNLAIFGDINRPEIDVDTILYDCEIRDVNIHLTGVLVILSINRSEVETQFLSGRSADNYSTDFDDIYINSFSYGNLFMQGIGYVGGWDDVEAKDPQYDLDSFNYCFGGIDDSNFVILPFYNASTELYHNTFEYDSYVERWLLPTTSYYSRMPYLLYIVETLFTQMGYTYNLTAWRNSSHKNLIITNSISPTGYYSQMSDIDIALILPKMSVTDFIENLEMLMNCEFTLDHFNKHITMAYTATIVANAPIVNVVDVVDDYTHTIDDEPNSDYKGVINCKYSGVDVDDWNYFDCAWYLEDKLADAVHYDTLADMLEDEPRSVTDLTEYTANDRLLYCVEVDAYFIMVYDDVSVYINADGSSTYTCYYKPQPINQYASVVDDDDDYNEIDIFPTPLKYTDSGPCVLVNYDAELSESDDDDDSSLSIHEIAIISGGDEDPEQYYSNISVAYWDGYNSIFNREQFCPFTSEVVVKKDWDFVKWNSEYSFSLMNKINDITGISSDKQVDTTRLYEYSFLSEEIPSVRSIFYINCQYYICASLTVTLTIDGKSQLITGEFYRLS